MTSAKKASVSIRLTDAPAGVPLCIVDVQAGEEARRRLLALGLHSGDVLQRLDAGSWGPVLVSNVTTRSTKVAIGRHLARRILVSHAPA